MKRSWCRDELAVRKLIQAIVFLLVMAVAIGLYEVVGRAGSREFDRLFPGTHSWDDSDLPRPEFLAAVTYIVFTAIIPGIVVAACVALPLIWLRLSPVTIAFASVLAPLWGFYWWAPYILEDLQDPACGVLFMSSLVTAVGMAFLFARLRRHGTIQHEEAVTCCRGEWAVRKLIQVLVFPLVIAVGITLYEVVAHSGDRVFYRGFPGVDIWSYTDLPHPYFPADMAIIPFWAILPGMVVATCVALPLIWFRLPPVMIALASALGPLWGLYLLAPFTLEKLLDPLYLGLLVSSLVTAVAMASLFAWLRRHRSDWLHDGEVWSMKRSWCRDELAVLKLIHAIVFLLVVAVGIGLYEVVARAGDREFDRLFSGIHSWDDSERARRYFLANGAVILFWAILPGIVAAACVALPLIGLRLSPVMIALASVLAPLWGLYRLAPSMLEHFQGDPGDVGLLASSLVTAVGMASLVAWLWRHRVDQLGDSEASLMKGTRCRDELAVRQLIQIIVFLLVIAVGVGLYEVVTDSAQRVLYRLLPGVDIWGHTDLPRAYFPAGVAIIALMAIVPGVVIATWVAFPLIWLRISPVMIAFASALVSLRGLYLKAPYGRVDLLGDPMHMGLFVSSLVTAFGMAFLFAWLRDDSIRQYEEPESWWRSDGPESYATP